MSPCKLNKQSKIQQSSEVLKRTLLRTLCALGTAALRSPAILRLTRITKGQSELHQQLLYFVYRLVFLRIAESKGLLEGQFDPLTVVLNNKKGWHALCHRFQTMWVGDETLGIHPIATALWDPIQCNLITNLDLSDEEFQKVMCDLTDGDSVLQWNEITSMALSSVFETVLELVPSVCVDSKSYTLQVKEGNNRKASGSYYTPTALVDRVLQSTLVPKIDSVLQGKNRVEQERALLSITVCDPSCGAGNFLVAAAHLLAKTLTDIRMDDSRPRLFVYQKAFQDVLKHCVYGVDLNPLTVEICKMVLWLELGIPNKGFGYLNNIQCGNALLGATPALIEKGIQTEYFELIPSHDDRTIRNAIAKTNRLECKGIVEDTVEESEKYTLEAATETEVSTLLGDAVCAALVWPKIQGWEMAPTHARFKQIRQGVVSRSLLHNIQQLRERYRFLHWHLVFPKVFKNGGFDVVIGNPPYLASRYLSKHHPYQRRAIPKLYKTASGNWDIYIPFTELGVRILKSGGFQAYVTPNKIIGAEYASVLQQEVFFTQSMLEVHDYSRLNLFDGANVAVVIVVVKKVKSPSDHGVVFYHYPTSVDGEPSSTESSVETLQSLPSGFISFPVTATDQSLMRWVQLSTKVEDVCSVSDGLSTDQAYKITKFVHDGRIEQIEDEHSIKLVNTGTIDPFHLQWGEKKIKFLGYEGPFPIIDRLTLQKKYPKRALESTRSTVAIAGLATRLEAAVLPPSFLSGVATVLLNPGSMVCPYAISTVLNAQVYSDLYKGLFGMSGMTADVLNYSARQVAQLPLPNTKYLCPYTGTIPEFDDLGSIGIQDGLLSALGQFGHLNSGQLEGLNFDTLINEVVVDALRRK